MSNTNPGGICTLAGEELDEVYAVIHHLEIERVRSQRTWLANKLRTILRRANDATQVKT